MVKMLEGYKNWKKGNKILFAIIIGLAVVSFWRGAWGLLDEYLFPMNLVLSYWVSLIIGVVILIVTHYTTKTLA
jgi:hypothetical protein